MPVTDVMMKERGPVRDEWFERAERVPMTKAPIRSMLLSLLLPLDGARVLEIGSGSGAMTIELLRAVGEKGRVTSLEISPKALSIAQKNISRARLDGRAELISGSAPKHIPISSFDVAFIGGHGSDLERIMGTCWDRLEFGGRMLLSAITPQTTSRALVYLEGLGVEPGFWRIQSAVGQKIGSEWLPRGNNPIDIIWGDK